MLSSNFIGLELCVRYFGTLKKALGVYLTSLLMSLINVLDTLRVFRGLIEEHSKSVPKLD